MSSAGYRCWQGKPGTCGVLALMLLAGARGMCGTPRAYLTPDDIQQGAVARNTAVQDISVRCNGKLVGGDRGHLFPFRRSRLLMKGAKMSVQWDVGFSENDIRYSGSVKYDGRVSTKYDPEAKSGTIMQTDAAFMRGNYYLRFSLTCPQGREDGLYMCLPELLRKPGLSVLPGQEKVGKRWCHVVEIRSIGYRIWIDPERGFAPLRWCLYRVKRGKDGFSLSLDEIRHEVVIDGPDLVEIAPNIWLPVRGRERVVDSFGNETLWIMRVERDAEGRYDLRVNCNLADSVFRFQFPLGTRVVDIMSKREYVVGSGDVGRGEGPVSDDVVDALVEDAVDQIRSLRPTEGPTSAAGRSWSWHIWVGGVAVALLAMLAMAWRRARTP